MIASYREGEIHILQLQHGKVNAMDMEFCEALIEKFQELERDTLCRAVVMRSGSKVFSAGIDLKRFLAESEAYVEPFMLKLEELFQQVLCFSKPLVSEINGAAIAGGCMVATACDYRVIESNSKIGILESRLGVPLPMTAIEILRHVANASAFKNIISVGATFVGEEAVQNGLADLAVSDTNTAAIQHARELAKIPLDAFRFTKLQRTRPIIRIIDANHKELRESYLKMWKSDKTRSAIQTYVQERLV